VILSYDHLFSGYGQRVEDVLKVFEDDSSDQMILLKDIEFYSTCEHHMLPFFGKAHIAYKFDMESSAETQPRKTLLGYSSNASRCGKL